jgi:glycerophosphoryl diester phosphodiesterase
MSLTAIILQRKAFHRSFGSPMTVLLQLVYLTIALGPTIVESDQNPKVLIMAHRGGKGLWPENTIYGYQKALETGVDVLEIDIWRTKDNVVVVNHDETVDRTTNGTGKINTFTLDELQQLDAGYSWSVDGTYPYRGAGHTISTLDQVLNQFPDARFNIDMKENSGELIDALCEHIEKHGAHDRIIVASFHQRALYTFRKRCPNVRTSAGVWEIIRFIILSRLHLTGLYTPPFAAFQLPDRAGPISVVNSTFIDAAHSRGIEVHPYTINDKADMHHLIEWGVDGIITDYPDRLKEVLAEESPPPRIWGTGNDCDKCISDLFAALPTPVHRSLGVGGCRQKLGSHSKRSGKPCPVYPLSK